MGSHGHFFGLFGYSYERNTPKTAPERTPSAKGGGDNEPNRAKTGECDSKKFFFVEISRSVLRELGRYKRNRIVGDLMCIESRRGRLLLAE